MNIILQSFTGLNISDGHTICNLSCLFRHYINNMSLTTLFQENYLLLEQDMVGDMRVNVAMNNGDTLQVYVGHHVSSMSSYGPSGARDTTQGFNMEQVRFCIF